MTPHVNSAAKCSSGQLHVCQNLDEPVRALNVLARIAQCCCMFIGRDDCGGTVETVIKTMDSKR